MFPKPKPQLKPNTYAYESEPLVKPTGFREYDARWLLGSEINLMGLQALGMGLGTLIRDMGVKPEIEVFDTGDLVFADDLIAEGVLDGPGVYSIVMGTKYGIPADPEAMIYCKNRLPKGAIWQGFGISKHTWAMAAQSVILGGNVRTGFEDSTYLGPGKQAKSNGTMVMQAAELVERLGREVATPGEARKQLGLPH